jgi:hypothetical protein
MPKKRKLNAQPETSTTQTGKKAAEKSKKAADTAAAIANIELDGEEDDEVPVYDSCDVIRRKVNAHLRKPGVTQAQFLRDLYAQLHGSCKANPLQHSQLSNFLGN